MAYKTTNTIIIVCAILMQTCVYAQALPACQHYSCSHNCALQPIAQINANNQLDQFKLNDTLDQQQQSTYIVADQIHFTEDNVSTLSGNALLIQGNQILTAETIRYDKTNELVSAEDSNNDIFYRDDVLLIKANHALFNLQTEIAEIQSATYQFHNGLGQGNADYVKVATDDEKTTPRPPTLLTNFTYTTCPDLSNPDWLLVAENVKIDHEKGKGSAKHAKLKINDTPIFYFPWISFPIDDRRKSGFLAPTIGRSNDQGIDFSLPYYLNIAPNYDATFTPRIIGNRGLMLGTEFRYLNQSNNGKALAHYLHDDDVIGDNRYYLDINHNQRLAKNWQSQLRFNRVSDDTFFEDFGDNLTTTATSYLRSYLNLSSAGNNWRFKTEFDDFQVVDNTVTKEPYRRVPRIEFDYGTPYLPYNLDFEFESELTYFDKDDDVTGARLHTDFALTRSFQKAAYFVEPSLKLYYTNYQLDNHTDNSISRMLPSFSLSSGLFFERYLKNNAWKQTLEPQIHYLYTPFEDQTNIPDFDTNELTFQYSSLFTDNRFTSIDRIGDTNQISVAVNSQILNYKTGKQMLDARIGQIFYLTDQKVQLDDTINTANYSPIIADLTYYPARYWTTQLGLIWDPKANKMETGLLRAQYRNPEELFVVNASYRFRQDLVDQTDISFAVPISRNWHLFGRWNYSFEENNTLEQLAGIEYNSCCWSFRLLQRSYLNNRNGENRDSLFLQVELKGLGNIGNDAETLLERSIFGYETN